MSRNDQLIFRFKERSHLQLQRVLHFGGWVRFTHLKHNFGSGNRAYRGPSLSIKIRASVPPQRVLSVPGAQPPPRLRALLPRHRPPPPGRPPPTPTPGVRRPPPPPPLRARPPASSREQSGGRGRRPANLRDPQRRCRWRSRGNPAPRLQIRPYPAFGFRGTHRHRRSPRPF